MPDISKCSNEECPLKESCYRWTSKPSEYLQSYAEFEFVVKEDEVACDYYWEVKK